jgi:hypothetical protein
MSRSFLLNNFNSPGELQYVNILNESSGIINIVTQGTSSTGMINARDLETFSYSSSVDSVISSQRLNLAGCTNCTADFQFKFYKSKTRSDVFYLFGHIYTDPAPQIPYHFFLGKYTLSSKQWSRGYRWNAAPATVGSKLDEDEKGNIYGVINTLNSMLYHHSGYVKFDSTGNSDGNWRKYFNGYNSGGSAFPDDRVNVIHSDKLIMNVSGAGFLVNPLTSEIFNPSVAMSCAPVAGLSNISSNGTEVFSPVSKPAQLALAITSMANVSPTGTAVVNFSVSQTFCTLMKISEFYDDKGILFYPNPVDEKLFFNGKVAEVKIFDINGKSVCFVQNEKQFDVSFLPSGIYFIRFETEKGIFTKKFVKQ